VKGGKLDPARQITVPEEMIGFHRNLPPAGRVPYRTGKSVKPTCQRPGMTPRLTSDAKRLVLGFVWQKLLLQYRALSGSFGQNGILCGCPAAIRKYNL
jgi:hypothetical protein